MAPPYSPVLFERKNSVMKVILNRGHKLNCLDQEMVSVMLKNLRVYEEDSNIDFVTLKGNGNAFCPGGDIKECFQNGLLGKWSYLSVFYARQLRLDYLIATYKKPVVALIHGLVMGGGAGLSMNAPFRIVTEKTVFAMPEASVGLFPDVGASYFLSRLPCSIGEYLGLTGKRFNGSEMLACGLATHFVLSKDLPLLEKELDEAGSDASVIRKVVDRYAHKPNFKEDSPLMRVDLVNKCFSKNTVEEILQSLEKEKEIVGGKWMVDAVNSMKQACPSSLKVFLRMIREGRGQQLQECLTRDYIVCFNILCRRVTENFYEGCRAMLFDEDKKPPKWEPSELESVNEEMVDEHFVEVDYEVVEPLNLPASARSSPPYISTSHARL